MKVYCALCMTEIPEKDMEEEGKAYYSCHSDWFCCDDHYYDWKELVN